MNDRLRGIHEQDQLLTDLAIEWESTDVVAQNDFMELLEAETPFGFQRMLDEAPVEWMGFIQRTMLAGLRQAMLQRESS